MIPVAVPRRLRIATRESALALWQAEHIRARLIAQYPGMVVDLLGLTTQGDRILDQPLSAIGGKGLFIKELEVGYGRRPGRPGRAFVEGCTDGNAAGIHAGVHHRARRCA